MNESIFSKTFFVWFGALICCFLWGSAFPFIKLGYICFNIPETAIATQILFAGVRFFLAGILAILIGSVTRKKFIYPKGEGWLCVFKLSSFQTIGQYVLFYIGLAHTSGVRASIMEGTNVFVAIFIASLIFHQEKLTPKKIIGSILGFGGVVLINVAGNSLGEGNFYSGDLLVFASTVCYAFSSVFLKRYSKSEDPIVLSAYQFLIGGLIMAVVGFLCGGRFNLLESGTKGILILGYLAFISAVAYSLWGILLKYNSISRVSVFGFMNPMFGVILSAILLKEGSVLSATGIASIILVCLGIFIVNKGEKINK